MMALKPFSDKKNQAEKSTNNLHIIAPNYVQTQHHLLDTARARIDAFVGFVQDNVDGLVEPLQGSLNEFSKTTNQSSENSPSLTTN